MTSITTELARIFHTADCRGQVRASGRVAEPEEGALRTSPGVKRCQFVFGERCRCFSECVGALTRRQTRDEPEQWRVGVLL